MTYKGSGKKITRVCEDCNKLLREADAWYTLGEKPNRRICTHCWYLWAGLNNPKESKNGI